MWSFPTLGVPRGFPLVPGRRVRVFEVRVAKQPDRVLDGRRPRRQASGLGVLVQRGDLVLGQTDTQLHTRMMLRSYQVGYPSRIERTGISGSRSPLHRLGFLGSRRQTGSSYLRWGR